MKRPQDRISKPVFAFESVFSEHAQTTQLALPTQIDPIIPSVMADQVARIEREVAERCATAKLAAARKERRRGRVAALVPGGVAVVAIAIAAFVGSFGQGDAHARAEVVAPVLVVEAPKPIAPEIAAALGEAPAVAPAPQPMQAETQAPPPPAATTDVIEISIVAPVVVRRPTNMNADTRAASPSRVSRSDGRLVPQAPAQPAPVVSLPPPPKHAVASAPPAAPAPAPAKAKADTDFEAAARAAAQAGQQLDSTLR